MTNVFQSLLLVIAGATQKELARQVKYLKVENEILRSKLPKRITVTPKERRRLVRFAERLGSAIHQLATIVGPGTLLRWIREDKGKKPRPPAKRGRRRTPEQIRRLVLKLARENEWGYTRILGELKKLGVRTISRNTVKRILKDAGFDPGPQRGEGTWDDFIKTHAASLWQCDFFSKRVVTLKGVREAFVLVFLNVKTRQVVLSPATLHPNDEWVVAQTESFVQQARDQGLPVRHLQHDNDTKFSRSFRQMLKRLRVVAKRGALRAPNTNAFVERFIQSIGQECLDRFVAFGERHLDYLCAEYLAHYHEERPHQSLDNEPLLKRKTPGRPRTKQSSLNKQVVTLAEVRCKRRLGGLLNSYHRAA
ncbi:MAG: DDE-type integrase/transposase/recombinase [Planctomycetes bacterium]|nr:DDE-type integrase/transposase/recombinase [Planctomycetota bacterium]